MKPGAAEMDRILVTGANGFIGGTLCRRLSEKGFGVRGSFRSRDSVPAFFEQRGSVDFAVTGDFGGDADWTKALEGVNTVIHLAARVHVMNESAKDPLAEFIRTNSVATELLARAAAKAGVRRIVYVSTIKVNGEKTGRVPFSEDDLPSPQDPYAVSKLKAEHALMRVSEETGLEFVILRPPLVYGPGVKGNMLRLMGIIHKGLPLPLAGILNKRSLIGLENIADALILSATRPEAAGQVFLLSDGEDVSTPDLVRMIASAMGRRARLLTIPDFLFRAASSLFPPVRPALERLTDSLFVDSSRFRKVMDWRPPQSLKEGIGTMVSEYLTGE